MSFIPARMFKTGVKYGIISTLLFVLLFIGLYLIDMNPYAEAPFFDFLLIPIFVFFSLYEFKSINEKHLEYAQGMTLGLMTVLLLSIISCIFIWLFDALIDNQELIEYVQLKLQALEENKQEVTNEMDEETYEHTRMSLANAGIGSVVLDNFLKKNILGVLLTVMISIILRKSSNKSNGK